MGCIKRALCLLTGLLAFAGDSHAERLPFPSVIGYWSFDDVKDSRVPDGGPYGYHATIMHEGDIVPQPAPGIRNNGLHFPSDHRAWVEMDKRLRLEPPFTIAAWVKVEANRATMELVGQKAHTARDGIRVVFSARQFRFEYSDGNESCVVSYDPHLTRPGQWAYVAVTHDGKEIALYVDGQEVKREEARPMKTGRRAVLLGNYVLKKDMYRFIGTMDEVVFLREALDSKGIARLGQVLLGSAEVRKPGAFRR